MHIPVLLNESLEYLAIRPDGVYVDATCGLGSHTAAIARQLTTGFVITNDRDAESLEMAKANAADCADRIRFHHGRFSELGSALESYGVKQADGLLADLGVSRYQLTSPDRGFSFMADSDLDMRLDRSQGETAADLVNYLAEKELADTIYRLGEERRSRKIARAIVRARPIQSTRHLAKVIESVAPRTGPIAPSTQTFMALRMAVNQELEELEGLLNVAPEVVRAGGRICVISFHSLEDRMVKQSFQGLVRSGRAVSLTRHVVRPGEEELRDNPAARSAKLRVVERKVGGEQ